jgi:signal transduction histidine kinase
LILTALFIFLLSLMTGQQMRAAVTFVVLLSAVGSMYGVYRTRQDQQDQQGQQGHQSEQSQQHKTRHATRHLKRLLLAISVALTVGTLFNGGVHAPGFIAFFVLFTLHVWISTTERVYGALVLFAMLGVSAIKLTELELVPTIEPPSPYYLLTLYTCFLFLIIRVLFSIKTLLFQSLGEVGHNQILLEGLFESSRDGLLICKPDLSIHRANQEAQELIDTLQAQGSTLSMLAVLWHRKSTTLGELLSSLQGDVPPINITLNKRSLELTSTPLVLDKMLAGYVITTRDVTELIIQRKRAQQADKMDAIGHVTSSIAHDFNNHITALKGSIECLADHPTPEQEEWLEMMRLSADQASDLVSQLLSFARDDPESIQTISLSATLNKATPLIKGALHKGVKLYIDIPKELNSQHKLQHISLQKDLVMINPNALINVLV